MVAKSKQPKQPKPSKRPGVGELRERVAELQRQVRELQAENERLRAQAAPTRANWLDHPDLAGIEVPEGRPDEAEIADREARLKRLAENPNTIVRRRIGPFVPYEPKIRVIGGETDVLKLLGRRGDEPDTPFDME